MSAESIIAKLNSMALSAKKLSTEAVSTLAERGAEVADAGFQSALSGYVGDRNVVVTHEVNGNKATITATGQAVQFLEFGSGVTYNSPRDYPNDLYSTPPSVVGIGEYGLGRGKKPRWAVSTKTHPEVVGGEPIISRKTGKAHPYSVWSKGNPPARAMYAADKEIRKMVPQLMKEVSK